METPVSPNHKTTWSYSALNVYDICPLKYYHEKIAKTVPFSQSPQVIWGLAVHKALEDAGNTAGEVTLPDNMSQYQKVADSIKKLATKVESIAHETKFAVTRESVPCGWDDESAYSRCVADVFCIEKPNTAIIIDYKTGRYRGKTKQAVINARMVFWHYPQVHTVKTSFAYVAEGVNDRDTFSRDTVALDFASVQQSIDNLEASVKNHNFPAKPGFLCRNWCGVGSCAHNGKAPQRRRSFGKW